MLIARENILLQVNNQLIPIAIRPKSISLEQICHKRSQGIVVTSLHCRLFFDVKKRPKDQKKEPEKSYQCSVSIEISLDLKVFFPRNVLKLTI